MFANLCCRTWFMLGGLSQAPALVAAIQSARGAAMADGKALQTVEMDPAKLVTSAQPAGMQTMQMG